MYKGVDMHTYTYLYLEGKHIRVKEEERRKKTVHIIMKQQIIEGESTKSIFCFHLVPFREYMNSSCRYTLGDRKAVEYCVGAYDLAIIG